MKKRLSSRWRADRRQPQRLLGVERLEDRTLLSGSPLATALPLAFTTFQTAHVAAFLSAPDEVDLYRITLNAGDQISTAVSARAAGSGLQSVLRVLDASGTPLALDDQEGGDPSLTFQAATAGDYFVSVSSAAAGSGTTTGLYALDIRRTAEATLLSDLAGSSFRLTSGATAAYGDSVSVTFTVDNRGGADAGPFTVDVVLSKDNLFAATSSKVKTFSVAGLGAGQTFSSGSFTVDLPAVSTATAAGLPVSGAVYLGLRITPSDPTTDSGQFDKSGVHRGTDWESLTILTPVPTGTTNLSAVDATLNTSVSGTLNAPTQVDSYRLTIPTSSPPSGTPPLNGRLTAIVTPLGNDFSPSLVLYGPAGQIPDGKTALLQSSGGTPGSAAAIVQELPPGSYSLAVSSQGRTGSYRLITEFVPVASQPIADNLSPVFINSGLPLEPLALDPTIKAPDSKGNSTAHPKSIAVADVNGDGIPDLITANYGTAKYPGNTLSVLLGIGGGSFRPPDVMAVGTKPIFVAVADVNGDGKPDLVVANSGSNTITVLLGEGDGSFRPDPFSSPGLPPGTFAVGSQPVSLAVADLNGDGKPDLVVATEGDNTVSVLLGNGDGRFQPQQPIGMGFSAPSSVAVSDLTGNGKPDVVVANSGSDSVTVLWNRTAAAGSLSFAQQNIQGFSTPTSVAVADLNGDGKPDLVVGDYPGPNVAGDTVLVLLNTTLPGPLAHPFAAPQDLHVEASAVGVAVADLNDDGQLDVVVPNNGKYTATALLNTTPRGTPSLSFAAQPTFRVGTLAYAVVLADVNGDGKPDLLVGNKYYTTVNTFLGNGDGSFQIQPTFRVNPGPVAVAVADVNGDGKPDLVTADSFAGTVSVQLGNGDGTFALQKTFAVGGGPDAVAVADVNGDGIPDMLVANYKDNSVSVLLGNGDGSFQLQQSFSAGRHPTAVAVADVNGDGVPDLIVANDNGNDPGTVTVLLGNGDGTFQDSHSSLAQHTFPVGISPRSVVVADVNGDGIPDLVTADYGKRFYDSGGYYVGVRGSGTVSVLLGDGHGSFHYPNNDPMQDTFTSGMNPTSATVADINGDGIPDLIVADFGTRMTPQTPKGPGTPGHPGNTVSVLLGQGGGSFQTPQPWTVGDYPDSVAVADLNGDGKPDLLVANLTRNYAPYGTVSVLLNGTAKGASSASFTVQSVPAGLYPASVAAADLNGDGVPDLAVANKYFNTVSVLLGQGDGSFTPSSPTSGVGSRNTPYLKDLDGDGIPDSVVLDSTGNLLFRKGLTSADNSADNSFAPPRILNPNRPARDLTVVNTGAGWAIATADARASNGMATVSFTTLDAADRATSTTAFATPELPTRLVAGDLVNPVGTRNGLHDLVLANSLDNSITIAFQTAPGVFDPKTLNLRVGLAPSDVTLADVNGDGLLDIVVTDQGSGDVSVFRNDATHSFSASSRFQTSLAPSDVLVPTSPPETGVRSEAVPVSVAAGNFTGAGHNDLVVVNRGTHSFTVLPGNGAGGFANPQADLTTPTSDGPVVNYLAGPVVAGYFYGPGQPLDLAVLMEDPTSAAVWIFRGDGHGHFTHTGSFFAGSLPTGLNVVVDATTGFADLLVGNAFGDVLILLGQGDGTFQPPTGNHVSLDVQTVAGQPQALVANQLKNHVIVQTRDPGSVQFVPTQTVVTETTLPFAPTDAKYVALNEKDPTLDAVVVRSASNSVEVYRPGAASQGYVLQTSQPVGTDPVSVTVQDVNGDGIPDLLVANKGSNDVSVLFGTYVNGQWMAIGGPRLKTGGSGPIAVAVRDVSGRTGTGGPDGIPDLVVTNSQSGTLTVLPGVGQGFFNDTNPQSFSLGGTPGMPSMEGNGLGVLPIDGRLVGFDLNNLGGSIRTVFAAAEAVNAVQALPGGVVVVALADGTVEELLPDAAGALTVARTFEPLTGMPADPSALAVLPTATGLEVLVTESGADQVFVFAAPGLPELPVPMPTAPPGPAVAVSVPEGVPEAVVVTFGTDQTPTASAAEEAPAETVAIARSASALPPGRAEGEEEDAWQEETRTEGEAAVAPDEYLRNLDLYVPVPDAGPNDPGAARPAPRLAPGETPLTGLAEDDLLPPWPADALLPLPDSLPAAPPVNPAVPPPPTGSPQPDNSGRPAPDAATPPLATATVEPPARTSDHVGPEKPASASPVPTLLEEACDAVFLPPAREDDRDLVFLTAVIVGGFALCPEAGCDGARHSISGPSTESQRGGGGAA